MSGLILNEPTQFYKAISSSNIIPGDTLYLRGGTYRGDWTLDIAGTLEAPITIKPYNLEPVIIDGTLTFGRPYVKIMDVEFTNSNTDRNLWDSGITMSQTGCWLIGCNIHDMHSDGVNWFGSGTGGVVECRISNCGSYAEGQMNDFGHAIYTHNNGGGLRLIARNLLLDQVGRYSIHIYSAGENYLKDYTCENNVVLHPVHTGGGLGLVDFIYRNNIQSGGYCQHGRYSVQANDTALIQDNVFIDLSSYYVEAGWTDLTETSNIVWNGKPDNRAGYTVQAKPANWSQFIPFTLSERWSGIQASIVDGVFDAVMVTR